MRSSVSFKQALCFNVGPGIILRFPERQAFTSNMRVPDSRRMGCSTLGRPSHVIALVCRMGHIGSAYAWQRKAAVGHHVHARGHWRCTGLPHSLHPHCPVLGGPQYLSTRWPCKAVISWLKLSGACWGCGTHILSSSPCCLGYCYYQHGCMASSHGQELMKLL